MLLSIIFATFALLSPSSASAYEFEGVWTGQGRLESPFWGIHETADVTVEITHQLGQLTARECFSFLYQETPARVCGTTPMAVVGSELYYQGIRLGFLTDNRIELRFEMANGQVEIEIEVISPGLVNYRYHSVAPDGAVTLKQAFGLIH